MIHVAPIQFVIPWRNDVITACTVQNGDSPLKWPSVKPCLLSTLGRTASDRLRSSAPLLCVSSDFMRSLIPPSKRRPQAIPSLLWLLCFANGMIYGFDLEGDSARVYHTLLTTLPRAETATAWILMENPTVTEKTATFPLVPNRPSTNLTISEVFVIVSEFGNGIALWLQPSEGEGQANKLLRSTEFRTPPSPATISRCQPQGSWLHLITLTGHVISVHFSVVISHSVGDECFSRYDLLCQPANFPHLPPSLTPTCSITQEKAKWRYMDIKDFVRLPDGHLGALRSSGEQIHLVDLLRQKEVCPNPSMEMNESAAVACGVKELIAACHELDAYLPCLRLLGVLDGEDQRTSCSFPNAPINRVLKTQVYLLPGDMKESRSAALDFVAEFAIQATEIPPCDNWNTLTMEELAFRLLVPSPETLPPIPLEKLGVAVKIAPVYGDTVIEDLNLPGVYQYSVPWINVHFSHPTIKTSDSDNQGKSNDLVARVLLPPSWCSVLLAESSEDVSANFLKGILVYITLDLQCPSIPANILTGSSEVSHSSYAVRGSALSVLIGKYFLDAIHLLSPTDHSEYITNLPLLGGQSNYLTMRITMIPPAILSEILKDAQKTKIRGLAENSTGKAIASSGHFQLHFVPTSRAVKINWSRVSPNCVETPQSDTFSIDLSSSCTRTLWIIYLAMVHRLSSVGASSSKENVDSSALPSIEHLRQEYCVLEDIENSLVKMRSEVVSASNSRFSPEESLKHLMRAFCSVRNTTAAALF
ncbi:unnamed protein product [Calicophoron daubneyi]|uniref:Uncharacterized protein n=1 Tax=Calicophoron daubneyi TaxID=300641 RepID=A0AAV2T215_CALDB